MDQSSCKNGVLYLSGLLQVMPVILVEDLPKYNLPNTMTPHSQSRIIHLGIWKGICFPSWPSCGYQLLTISCDSIRYWINIIL